LSFVLAACGGFEEVDLTGTYQVDVAVGSMPCATDMDLPFADFVKFSRMDLLGTGAEFFGYEDCTDAAATDCSPSGEFGFFEPLEDGWLGRASQSSGGGAVACSLSIVRQTAILRGDRTLEIEITGHEEEVLGLSEEDCNPDTAEQRGDAMPCVRHQLVQATRL
jgi:hypothetical protein